MAPWFLRFQEHCQSRLRFRQASQAALRRLGWDLGSLSELPSGRRCPSASGLDFPAALGSAWTMPSTWGLLSLSRLGWVKEKDS